MVRVKVIKDNDNYKQIKLTGHANYQDYGKDIVCAAISATYICTVNAILRINENDITVTQKNDISIIDVINNTDITKKLLDNMIMCLKELEKQYPKNIEIK